MCWRVDWKPVVDRGQVTLVVRPLWSQRMGLCEVVASLAEAVAAAFENRSDTHNLVIQILRLGPLYRDANRLDAWEEAYSEILNDDKISSPTMFEVLDAIARLSSYNMCAGFDVKRSRQEYKRVAILLQSKGVPIPADLEFSDW